MKELFTLYLTHILRVKKNTEMASVRLESRQAQFPSQSGQQQMTE